MQSCWSSQNGASSEIDGSHLNTNAFMIDTWYMTADDGQISTCSFNIGSSDQ